MAVPAEWKSRPGRSAKCWGCNAKLKGKQMDYLMQRIDTNTTWFIVAVVGFMLISVVFGAIGAKLELRDARRKQELLVDKRREDFLARLYRDLDTPTFMREARHPMDSVPYDVRKMN